MKKVLAGCLVILAFALLSSPAYSKDVVVGAFTSLENEYYSNWNKGAEQAAEALGLEYRPLVDNNSAAKQMEIYETQLQAGVKMFFGTSPFTGNIPLITKKVKEKGAYYVGLWDCVPWFHPLDTGALNYATYFAPDDFQNAYMLAKAMFQKMGGKGKIVQISGWPGASVDVQRTMGMMKALKEFPGIELLDSQPGKWNQIDSRKVMEDFLVAYPKIDGVFAQNDSEGVGALQACQDAGIEVPITGFDGNAEFMQLIKEGLTFGTITYTPGWQAGYAIVRLYDVFHGWKPQPLERMMFTGASLITKDNVDVYNDYIYGPKKLPFDWKKMSRVLNPKDWDPQNYVWPMDLETLWDYAKDKKPSGYILPTSYRDAVSKGEIEELRSMYKAHYQRKIPE